MLPDGRLEGLDLLDHLRVERRDLVLRVDAVQHLDEAARTEDHLERRALALRVERDDPACDRLLAPREVVLRDAEGTPVLLDLGLDVLELQVREVQPLVGGTEARIEAAELAEHLSRLGLLGRDRGRRSRESRDCGEESRQDPEEHVPHLSTSLSDDAPQVADGPRHRRGVRCGKSGDVSRGFG